MEQKTNVNNRFSKILLYIFCMAQIIFSNESAYTLYIFKSYNSAIIFDIILIIFTIYYSIQKKFSFFKTMILALVLFSICVFNSMIVNSDFNIENLLVINAIINGCVIASIFDIKEYLKVFKNCILFFCLYGLIVTYIMLPLHMTSLFTTYYNPATNIPYFNAGFSFVMGWNGLMRLQAIFREPGVLQIYILIAMMVELFIDDRKFINIVLLVIAMIMTFSTALLISSIPFFAAVVIKRDKKKAKYLIILIIILLFIATNDSVSGYLNKSLAKIRIDSTESTMVRYNSIKYLLMTSFKNPLFGNSYVNGYYSIRYFYGLTKNADITGTFFTNIMAAGYIYGLTIIILFYKFVKDNFSKDNVFVSILLFISLFLAICSQNIVYSSILWTFVFFEIKNIILERKKNSNEKN